jgi:hypothetical protein
MFCSVLCDFICPLREFCKCLEVFFMSVSLFMGQLSVLATAAISPSLSSFSNAHSINKCSAVWLSFPHGQFGASIILNL